MTSRVSAHEAGPTRLRFTPHCEQLFTGGADSKVNVFDFELVLSSNRPVRSLTENTEEITCIEFDRGVDDGSRCAVGGQDGVVVLYEGGASRTIFRQPACVVHACPFSPCGKHVAVASDNGLRVVSTVEGCSDATEVMEAGETALAASWLACNVIVAAGVSGVYAWDMSTGAPVQKKFAQRHRLTQARQRNETAALKLPGVRMMGVDAFAFPAGKQVVVQPVDGKSVALAVPDLPQGREVLLLEACAKTGTLAALDEVGYLTFYDLATLKVLSRMRPILSTPDEEICDLQFHPTQPGTVVTTTSSGMVQLLAGAFEAAPAAAASAPKGQKKKDARKEKKEKKEKRGRRPEEGEEHTASKFEDECVEDDEADFDGDQESSESSVDLAHFEEEGEGEGGDEGGAVDMECDDMSAGHSDSLESGCAAVRIREGQAHFQIGQTPPNGFGGVDGARILCWNRIGFVRSVVSEETGATTLSIHFYDKATYSAVRFADKSDFAPLTIAALGRRGCVFASSSPGLPNRLSYRALQSWGTNPDWSHTFQNEEPRCLAVGDVWVACFTNRFLRVFTHTGVAVLVVSLPHRVVCCTGLDSGLPPSAGDIPLAHNVSDLLTFVADCGTGLQLFTWNMATMKEVDAGVPVALSPGSSLAWLGWTDDGMVATQDSEQVLRVLTHAFGRQWMPVYDPKSLHVFERLHILSVRGGQFTAVPFSGVGPDPRLEEQPQVTRALSMPVLVSNRSQQLCEKEASAMLARITLHEKKERSEYYTADIAKLELKQDVALFAMFKQAIQGQMPSTARALDIARGFNMKDRLEKGMEFAFDNKEQTLYEKMRVMMDEFGPKQVRRCKLPNKPKNLKKQKAAAAEAAAAAAAAPQGLTADERIDQLVKQQQEREAALSKQIASLAEEAKEAKEAVRAAAAARANDPPSGVAPTKLDYDDAEPVSAKPTPQSKPSPFPVAAAGSSPFASIPTAAAANGGGGGNPSMGLFASAAAAPDHQLDVASGMQFLQRPEPPRPAEPAAKPAAVKPPSAAAAAKKPAASADAAPNARKRKADAAPAAKRAKQAAPAPSSKIDTMFKPQAKEKKDEQEKEMPEWYEVQGNETEQDRSGLLTTSQVLQSEPARSMEVDEAKVHLPPLPPAADAPAEPTPGGPSSTMSQVFDDSQTEMILPLPTPTQPTPTPTPTPSQQAATPTKAASATPQKAAGLPSQLPTSPKQPSTPQNDGMAKLAMLRRKKPAKPAGAPQSPAPASPAPAAPAAPAPAAAAAPVPAAPAAAAPAQQSPAPAAAAPPVAAWRSPKPEPPTERKYLDGALKEEVIVPERATAALTGGLKVNSFDRARQIADGMDEDDGSDDGDFAPIKIG